MKKFSDIGQRIRKIREENGLSQTELAKILGFSVPAVVSRFEKGERLPGVDVLIKISELYKIDLHWLITGQTMDFKRASEIIIKQAIDFQKTTAEKFQNLRDVWGELDAKKSRSEPLTQDEIKTMNEYEKELDVLCERLRILHGFHGWVLPALADLVRNLKKGYNK